MEKDDLKSMWMDAHSENKVSIYDKVNIEKSITLNHSKFISTVINDIKLRILSFSALLIIYFGLMVFAFIYLSLKLSVYSLIPIIAPGIFLVFMTTSEIVRLKALSKSDDNLSIKESLFSFRIKLNRIKAIDFLSWLIFLYLLAFLIIFNYLKDIGGVNNLSWINETLPVSFLGVIIILLLFLPWFVRSLHNRRYKKLYSTLKESSLLLDDTL
jgi:hypothetical protein